MFLKAFILIFIGSSGAIPLEDFDLKTDCTTYRQDVILGFDPKERLLFECVSQDQLRKINRATASINSVEGN